VRDKLLSGFRGLESPELKQVEARLLALQKQLAALPGRHDHQKSPTNGYHSGIAPTADVEKMVQLDLGQAVPIDMIRLWPARPTDFKGFAGFGFPVPVPRGPLRRSDLCQVGDRRRPLPKSDFANPETRRSRSLWRKKGPFRAVTTTRLWLPHQRLRFRSRRGAGRIRRQKRGSRRHGHRQGFHRGRTLEQEVPRRQFSTAANAIADIEDPKVADIVRLREQLADHIRPARKNRSVARCLDRCGHAPPTEETLSHLAAVGKGPANAARIGQGLCRAAIKPRPIHILHRGDVERNGDLVLSWRPGPCCCPALSPDFKLANLDNEGWPPRRPGRMDRRRTTTC